MRFVRAGLALVFTASMATNVLLLALLSDSFSKIQYARIFPTGFSTEVETPPPDVVVHGSIAFWGDSRAYLWDTTTFAPHERPFNLAHGGLASSQLLIQLETLPPFHTDVSVVQIGINDLHPLGALESNKAEILSQLRRNIPKIRDHLLSRSGVVVLTTIFPPTRVPIHRRLTWDTMTLQYIDEVNDEIRSAASVERVVVLDAHELLSDADSYLSARYADNDFFLHVNSEAYRVLNSELRRLLAQRDQSPGR